MLQTDTNFNMKRNVSIAFCIDEQKITLVYTYFAVIVNFLEYEIFFY